MTITTVNRQQRKITNFDVITEVWLGTNEHNGCLETSSMDLWHPLLSHIVERRRRHDAEAQDEYVGVWITERPQ